MECFDGETVPERGLGPGMVEKTLQGQNVPPSSLQEKSRGSGVGLDPLSHRADEVRGDGVVLGTDTTG